MVSSDIEINLVVSYYQILQNSWFVDENVARTAALYFLCWTEEV
jgi:hypothetical protein